MSDGNVHFDGIDGIESNKHQRRNLACYTSGSERSLLTAPAAPPEQHKRQSLTPLATGNAITFGGLSKFAAFRSIRRETKLTMYKNKGWDISGFSSMDVSASLGDSDKIEADEATALMGNVGHTRGFSTGSIPEIEVEPLEAVKEMFIENKINVLMVFLPFAYVSHAWNWNDGSIFILNFLAMVPLASMLGSELFYLIKMKLHYKTYTGCSSYTCYESQLSFHRRTSSTHK